MSKPNYYQIAGEASSKINGHRGLLYIQKKAKHNKNILDVGCGEGTRLSTLLPKNKKGVGVDISKQAIGKAKLKYPRHKFVHTQDETLPFKDNSFDLIYTAFVLEHTKNPKKFIKEIVRVLDFKGELVIICPNYGAPNRRSPNSKESPVKKLLNGFFKDFSLNSNLNWTKVTPKKRFKKIDDDTTVEPYILSLKKYLESKNLKVSKTSSLWRLEEKTTSLRKLLFLVLGKLGVFPFKYWGPQIFLVAKKK
jgi:ubiquinone/menaquinone biosynthesis C-methylase UbiE